MPAPALLRRLGSKGHGSPSKGSSHERKPSWASDTSSHTGDGSDLYNGGGGELAPPVLVYHANARSIVFRDQLRRAADASSSTNSLSSSRQVSFSEPDATAAEASATASVVVPDKRTNDNNDGGGSGSDDDVDVDLTSTIRTTHVSAAAAAAAKSHPVSPTSPCDAKVPSSFGSPKSASNKSSSSSFTKTSSATSTTSLETSLPPPETMLTNGNSNDPEHVHVNRLATAGACAEHLFQSAVLDADNQDLLLTGQVPPPQIAGYCEKVQPLEPLALGPNDTFQPLLDQDVNIDSQFTAAEAEVVQMLRDQKAFVKTIKNPDWTSFLQRFIYAQPPLHHRRRSIHDDLPPAESAQQQHYNSFVTSTTLLPPLGLKMRCYGSNSQYTTGVVFAQPQFDTPEQEQEAATATETWSWPAGYSAKTEFNRDSRGKLINGRTEALTPLSTLREYNEEYASGSEYITVNGRRVTGIQQLPYNEIFLRVGGPGRIVQGKDVATGIEASRSFETGVGLPVALFCRTATFGHLISLLRTRARFVHTIGGEAHKNIPLLLIAPDLPGETGGVRVLTDDLLQQLWKVAAQQLSPFQNSTIAHRTSIHNNDDDAFQQKLDELLDLDESLQAVLTPEELIRVAGGFGATDESVAAILKQVRMHDEQINKSISTGKKKGVNKPSHKLQDVVNEGLTYATRSGDYHTARQLLILYSLVASQPDDDDSDDENEDDNEDKKDEEVDKKKESGNSKKAALEKSKKPLTKNKRSSSMSEPDNRLARSSSSFNNGSSTSSTTVSIPAPPPPPPLDTDRLRGATNSDGLLAVLGAAQVLAAMQDGGAKTRTEEAISAVEEWVNYGEQSMAFRISSWYDQRAAQGDLKIATENNSQFMAFVSNKAISNRKAFCQQLRDAAATTNFNDVSFLQALHQMLSKMHSPCLRLELLQYVLGLDNRYSVAHVARSIELAATCLGISSAATTPPTTTTKIG